MKLFSKGVSFIVVSSIYFSICGLILKANTQLTPVQQSNYPLTLNKTPEISIAPQSTTTTDERIEEMLQNINEIENPKCDISAESWFEHKFSKKLHRYVQKGTIPQDPPTPHFPLSTATIHMQPLPKDFSTWKSIRTENMVYVDKTKYLLQFKDDTSMLYHFTRPRRFGKTLFLQTIASYFRGEKSLFRNTSIFEKGNVAHDEGRWVEYPVIELVFSEIIPIKPIRDASKSIEEMHTRLDDALTFVAKTYNISIHNYPEPGDLIRSLFLKFKLPVVVLIDEYDAAANYAIYGANNENFTKEVTRLMTIFYTNIKAASDFIKLAWITGVNKIALDSLESGPNSFKDCSHSEEFEAVVGFSKSEILDNFASHIKYFAIRVGKTEEEIIAEMTKWYGGYRFSGFSIKSKSQSQNNLFNPISVMNCLRECKFKPYWSLTKSVKYIVETFYNNSYKMDQFRNLTTTLSCITQRRDPTSGPIPTIAHMFNTGYLTVISYDHTTNSVTLNFPNYEIEDFLNKKLLEYVPSEGKFLDKMGTI